MNFPIPGSLARVKFLEIDEMEVIVWLPDYNMKGVCPNTNMMFKPDHIQMEGMGEVFSIDYETKNINFKQIQVLSDTSGNN